ncbi:two-component sensor histidine kinase [Geothrix limicola]|uniref:histidine kinase n=1 Tax=Geothrix limicola TaxID=2927978 RepID=A0ABQ5QGI1_9BACT|nr:sensor histidine kinase KdpD [Geothrix limicola]GLH73500.1 two-component sensor histidine kinase [Geothrix limicola]
MREPGRPDPEPLLRRVQEEEARALRAKLKVFFGAAPGVGKTYAMLSEAQERRKEGFDVLVGVVETHGRSETAALLEGLEVLPRQELAYAGQFLPEFDLDAALKRRPSLILMDELAHSNVMGSRHVKRWQDVMELLDAGIDVYTTMNVQHLESLRDVVAQITGVIVRENVPDTVLERADEVELVDLPPDDLLVRLKEGKVYLPDQARHAQDHFFRKGNLLALRELALRHTAESVDAQMRRYMASEGIRKTWAAGDRLLVCVSPGELSERLIRGTRRMAGALGAPWMALYVESRHHLRFTEEERARIESSLRLAEKLGGETAVIEGAGTLVEDILTFAQDRNITKIVVGKPSRPRWVELLRGSTVDDLIRDSGTIDVYVISGEPGREPAAPLLRRGITSPARNYLLAALVVGLASGAAGLIFRRNELADIIMVYLLGILIVATRFGRGPSLLASILSVAAVDFLFVPPYLTFAVTDFRHVGTFAVMLLLGLVIGNLTERIRAQARLARGREQRTHALYRLGQELARSAGSAALVASAIQNVATQFQSQGVVLQPDEHGRLQRPEHPLAFPLNEQELGVAQWVFDHAEPAGLGTLTLPGARATYLPLKGARGAIGVMGVLPEGAPRWAEPDQRQLLEAFANQTALALERALLAEQSAFDRQRADEERLRNALLSSVSHDLRTPLGVITGAVSTALETPDLAEPARRELLQSAQEEAQRLHRLVSNLLDITRLESGALDLHTEWMPLEEVVGSALNRREMAAEAHRVRVSLPEDLPLVAMDGVLMEQLLLNLLDNALKYSPPGSPVDIKAWAAGKSLTLSVSDRGPGIPPGEEARIFEKLARGQVASNRPGAGLGLAICKGIAMAHGGHIQAVNHPQGGAQFLVMLPLGTPPSLPEEAL